MNVVTASILCIAQNFGKENVDGFIHLTFSYLREYVCKILANAVCLINLLKFLTLYLLNAHTQAQTSKHTLPGYCRYTIRILLLQ